jgi:hypothetical protein
MDDPLVMGSGEALRDLPGEIEGLAYRQGSRAEPRPQRLAFQQLGNDVGRAALAADVVDGRDAGVVQQPRRARFLLEAPEALGVADDVRGKDLDRDLASEPGVARAVHLAHAARSEQAQDFVGAQARPGGERHFAGTGGR